MKRLINELYQGHTDNRDQNWLTTGDRRGADRRQRTEPVLIDTRCDRARRASSGRRWVDEDNQNQQKIGIDIFV
ncbi:MAG: hypothetical protein OEZ39_16760 [Gammaproteobacteria bacterium]|nr:hypothetical protein [Gammaproteobacteria bacterium]MDH5653512.1 hypothetical protein [Gammaproteobacteria bacterium]